MDNLGLLIFYISAPIFLENFNSDFSSMTLSQCQHGVYLWISSISPVSGCSLP